MRYGLARVEMSGVAPYKWLGFIYVPPKISPHQFDEIKVELDTETQLHQDTMHFSGTVKALCILNYLIKKVKESSIRVIHVERKETGHNLTTWEYTLEITD